MTKISKIVLGFGVGIVLSFGAGAYLGFAARGAQAVAEEIIILAKFGVTIDLAEKEGKPGAHEAALREFVAFAEAREPVDESFFSEIVASEAAFAYLILAKAEEGRGNTLKANEYYKKSEQKCAESFLGNCSIAHMSRLAAEFSYSPLPKEVDQRASH